MMTAKELMSFIESLDQRGLLAKSPDTFDYEWVIWDYLKSKAPKECSHYFVLSYTDTAGFHYKPCEFCGVVKW